MRNERFKKLFTTVPRISDKKRQWKDNTHYYIKTKNEDGHSTGYEA